MVNKKKSIILKNISVKEGEREIKKIKLNKDNLVI